MDVKMRIVIGLFISGVLISLSATAAAEWHENAQLGIKVETPDGWASTVAGNQLILQPEDESLTVAIVTIDYDMFEKAVVELPAILYAVLTDVKVKEGEGEEGEVGGLRAYRINGTGMIGDTKIQWALALVQCRERLGFVIGFAETSSWPSASEEVGKIIDSIKTL